MKPNLNLYISNNSIVFRSSVTEEVINYIRNKVI